MLQSSSFTGHPPLGQEEMLLTLYLSHMSFNPSWNGWCPLKGRAISLAGAKKLSPSEMPQSLSIYNSRGRHRPCTGKRQAQWEGGKWVVVIQRLEKFWVIPVLSPAKITLHKSASLLLGGQLKLGGLSVGCSSLGAKLRLCLRPTARTALVCSWCFSVWPY